MSNENEVKAFAREELIAVKERANVLSKWSGLNPFWARAYTRLADAADVLDAMNARCEDRQ